VEAGDIFAHDAGSGGFAGDLLVALVGGGEGLGDAAAAKALSADRRSRLEEVVLKAGCGGVAAVRGGLGRLRENAIEERGQAEPPAA
jgi:hypothetical protein